MHFYNICSENCHKFSDLFYRSDEQYDINYYDGMKIEEIMMNTGKEYFNEFNILSIHAGFPKAYFGCATAENWDSGELVLIVISDHPVIYSVIDDVYNEGELSCGNIKWIEDESDLHEYFRSMGIGRERYRNRLKKINWDGGEKVLAFCEYYIVHGVYTLRIIGFSDNRRNELDAGNQEYEQEPHIIFEINIKKDDPQVS